MTEFDILGKAVFDYSVRPSRAVIERAVTQMGLTFPLHIMVAKPVDDAVPTPGGTRHRKYFSWHIHEGSVYLLWSDSAGSDPLSGEEPRLCGEAVQCARPEEFIAQLQSAIILFRRVELDSLIDRNALALSFAAELEARHLALARVRGAIGKSTFTEGSWRGAVEIWLDTVLLRHQRHLKTLHRKTNEFLSFVTSALDDSLLLSNYYGRVQRELHQIYSLSELRERFPGMIAELVQETPWQAVLSSQALSPITKKALEWIEKNHCRRVTIAQCAASIPVSEAYLSRLLRRETGLSPIQHLHQKRLDHAKVLLQEERLTIAEIADRAGFGTPEQFFRMFRKKVGITPATYRRKTAL